MPTDPTMVTKAAEHGWEAALLAAVFIACVTLLTYIIKAYMGQAMEREARMAKRIDGLEDYQRTTMVMALKDNTLALERLSTTLEGKPCLLDPAHQNGIMKAMVAEIAENLAETEHK